MVTLLSTQREEPAMPSHRKTEPDPLRGSVDLLILKALSLESMHGWGIGARIQQMSTGTSRRQSGMALPALQRLEHRGDIESAWQTTENNRRARYYTITARGRRELGREVDKWKRFTQAIT